MKVSIRKDRVIECDDKPFFPLQARHLPTGATLKELAEAGFNCFRHLVYGGLNMDSTPLPDELHGLKICAYLYNRMNFATDSSYKTELTAAVEELRDNDNLLSYENCNEPAFRPDAPTIINQKASDLEVGFQRLKEIDPHHPVHMGHGIGGSIEALREYNVCSDVTGCNPYPIMPANMRRHIGIRADGRALDSPNQTLSAVAQYTRKMIEVGEGRPVWMQFQAMAWEDFYGPLTKGGMSGPDPSAILYPTYAQMRYMAFADIVAGATGLIFSMYHLPYGGAAWEDVRLLMGELQGLHDVLAGRTVCLPLTPHYRNLGFTIWDGVQTMVKEHNGQHYLLAVNSAFDPTEVTWTGFDAKGASSLNVLNEDRQISVHQGTATDYFEPYAVHIYQLQ